MVATSPAGMNLPEEAARGPMPATSCVDLCVSETGRKGSTRSGVDFDWTCCLMSFVMSFSAASKRGVGGEKVVGTPLRSWQARGDARSCSAPARGGRR